MSAAYRDLEKLVHKIQSDLAPDAEVIHDTKLPGRFSKAQRQIDVLVKQKVGQYDINIIIDCKDYNKPIDVKGVEEFNGLYTDVGAQKGVLVCPAGFTKAAKELAQHLQIDLYSPVDTDPHKWTARVTIPVICDLRSAKISFGVAGSSPSPLSLAGDFITECSVYELGTGRLLPSMRDQAVQKWNSGGFPMEPGTHRDLPLFDTMNVEIDNGHGGRAEVSLYAGIWVERYLYYHQLKITKITGFKDEIKGDLITNAFETGILSMDDVETSWKRLKDESEAPVRPVLTLTALYCWD
jgi:hypothetical protein